MRGFHNLPLRNLVACAWAVVAVCAGHVAKAAPPPSDAFTLVGTSPLAQPITDGIREEQRQQLIHFYLMLIAATPANRDAAWRPDFSSFRNYRSSIQDHRQNLRGMLGLIDAKLGNPQIRLLFESNSLRVEEVTIPIDEGFQTRALLFLPRAKPPSAAVIVIPSELETPEQCAGIASGMTTSKWMNALLGHHIAVAIPALTERRNNHPLCKMAGGQDQRRILWRAGFIVGRTLVWIEVQQVLALRGFLAAQLGGGVRKIAVLGHGQGGMAALYAGAMDDRWAAIASVNYFQHREETWKEPVDRVLYGQLNEFGDAEVAALIAPRPLIIARTPDGGITAASVSAELARARRFYAGLKAPGSLVDLGASEDAIDAVAIKLAAVLGEARIGKLFPSEFRIPTAQIAEAASQTFETVFNYLRGLDMASAQVRADYWKLNSTAPENRGEKVLYLRKELRALVGTLPGDEIRMEGFANLTCGNTPLYATANRLYYRAGSGSAQPAREVYEFMRRVEPFHKDSTPVPYVSIVPTWESQQLWRTGRKSANWPSMCNGMGLAMLDSRISVDVNVSTEMNDAWLAQQRVIALCGASGISNQQADQLAKWVEQGGGLLATYDTGLYDERGQQRNDGGALTKLLGVRMKGAPLPSQPECFYRVRESHAALGEISAGATLQGDGKLVPADAIGDAKVLADCWNLGTNQVRGPAVVLNSHGKGRTIYVSGSLEANYLYDRVKSNQQLLASMVQYLGGDTPQPFLLGGPKGVYGILRRAPNGDLALWVLANVGFKDAASGRMRQEYTALRDVEVGIRIPQGRKSQSLRLVRAGKSVPVHEENGYAMATIPNPHIAEIVRLEFA